jgi:hypothetical protein
MEGSQLRGSEGRQIWRDDITVIMRNGGVSEEDAENRETYRLGERNPNGANLEAQGGKKFLRTKKCRKNSLQKFVTL